jgi:hypothetical protein
VTHILVICEVECLDPIGYVFIFSAINVANSKIQSDVCRYPAVPLSKFGVCGNGVCAPVTVSSYGCSLYGSSRSGLDFLCAAPHVTFCQIADHGPTALLRIETVCLRSLPASTKPQGHHVSRFVDCDFEIRSLAGVREACPVSFESLLERRITHQVKTK